MMRRRSQFICLSLASLFAPTFVGAQVRTHVQGHLARAVDGWQSEAFGFGGGLGASLEYALHPSFGLTAGGAYTALSRGDGTLPAGLRRPDAGGYGTVTVGLRARPFARRGLPGERLWIALDGGIAITGSVVRPTLGASVGYGFGIGGGTSLGPWMGFTTVLQTDADNVADDARLALVGLSLTLGGERAPRVVAPPPPPPPPPAPRCAELQGDVLPDADGDGCPEGDLDRDGIADRSDRCPATPEDRDGFEDADGCPDPDNDADGILDPADACPNVAEVVNGVDDGDGCPDEAAAVVVHGRIELGERVHFHYDSVRVHRDSRGALEAVARIMAAHPEYQVLSIEGHADERGSDAYNDELSHRRANAVAEALASVGVARERLRALGFGRRLPRTSGSDNAAHAVNRRVEFVIDGNGGRGIARTANGYVRIEQDGTMIPTEAP